MLTQIKAFEDLRLGKLQREVNDWLQENRDIQNVNISFTTAVSSVDNIMYTAFITYQTQDDNK